MVIHSVVFSDADVQVSFNDPEARDAHGVVITTAVITLEEAIGSEVAEVTDAVEQLLASWLGLRRETGP